MSGQALCGTTAWPRWSNAQGLTARLQSLPACPLRGAIAIRRLTPHDGELLREFVVNLSAASRMARFHAVLQDLSPSLLERLLRDDPREHALVATQTFGGREFVVGEARYALDDDDGFADAREFAVAVADDRRRRGLATTLLATLSLQALRSGVRRLYGDLLRDNRPMLGLARKLGFAVRTNPGDPRLQRVELRFDADALRAVDRLQHATAAATAATVFPA